MSDRRASGFGLGVAAPQVGVLHEDDAFEGPRSPARPGPGEFRGLPPDKRLKRHATKRSGGPSSPQGRARAAQNSLTHGAYSAHPTHLDAYHGKLRGVVDELNPIGVIAKTLCQDIAHGLAKLETLNAYERDRIHKAEHDGVGLHELARRLDFPWAETHLDALGAPQAEGVLRSQVLRAWRVMAKPPTVPPKRPSSKGSSAKRAAAEMEVLSQPLASGGLVPLADLSVSRIYERACELLSSPTLNRFEHAHFLQELDVVMLVARQGQGYLGRRLAESGDTSTLVAYWLLRNHERVLECVSELKNERTMGILTEEKISRARSHVQRGLRDSLGGLEAARELRKGSWE